MKIGGNYNWKNQPERLVYIGRSRAPGQGGWHQFEKVGEPGVVWCEVLDCDLHRIEETQNVADAVFLAPTRCRDCDLANGCPEFCRCAADGTSAPESADAQDAARYRKLRGWMSSNVPEGWQEVERMGALCAWMDWATMDAYLDGLPECSVGLMAKPASRVVAAVPPPMADIVRKWGRVCMEHYEKPHACGLDRLTVFFTSGAKDFLGPQSGDRRFWPVPADGDVEAWDASRIKPPGWDHVFAAFVDGAREARANPDATDADFQRAADGHTKRVFEEVDPASEAALRTESWKSNAGVASTQKPRAALLALAETCGVPVDAPRPCPHCDAPPGCTHCSSCPAGAKEAPDAKA